MKRRDGYGECGCVIHPGSGDEEGQRKGQVLRLRMSSPRVPVSLAVLVALTAGAALHVALLDLLRRQALVGEKRPRLLHRLLRCGRKRTR